MGTIEKYLINLTIGSEQSNTYIGAEIGAARVSELIYKKMEIAANLSVHFNLHVRFTAYAIPVDKNEEYYIVAQKTFQ